MKKVLIVIIVVIAAIILAIQINRENARINREAIDALPNSNPPASNIPLTREEVEAQRQNQEDI